MDEFTIIGFFGLAVILAFLIPAILFLLSQYRTLKLIKPENRTISPGLVWVQLIPLVNLVVQFIVVSGISNSIVKEANSADGDSLLGTSAISPEDAARRPTLWIGITYCILFCLSTSISLGSRARTYQVPEFQGLFGLGAMVCWIIYWVELAKYKRKLSTHGL